MASTGPEHRRRLRWRATDGQGRRAPDVRRRRPSPAGTSRTSPASAGASTTTPVSCATCSRRSRAAGANGCGFEQQLVGDPRGARSVRVHVANAGFLRDDANLAVVILADEDDCSFADSALLSSDTSQLGPLQSFRCTRYGVTCDDGGTTSDAMNQVGAKTGCHPNTDVAVPGGRPRPTSTILQGASRPIRRRSMVAAIVGDAGRRSRSSSARRRRQHAPIPGARALVPVHRQRRAGRGGRSGGAASANSWLVR